MSNISDEYNALPYDVRVIAGRVIDQTRINQLLLEKQRLNKRHAQSIKEINEHIRNLERSIKDALPPGRSE